MTKVLILRARDKIKPIQVRGIDIVQIPVIYTVPNEEAINTISLAGVDYVIVMSSMVVKYLGGKLKTELGDNTRLIGVGPATCEAIRRLGLNCEMPSEYSSYGVVEYMRNVKGGKVVILRSSKGSDYVRTELSRLGFNVNEYGVYDVMVDPIASRIACGLMDFVDFVVFMSPMTYEAVSNCARDALSNRVVVAIGRTTAMRLLRDGIRALTPHEYTQDGVLGLINQLTTSSESPD
ncbi:MAG: uroporphyrinogen-III synthase [Vulcanisaeta sp.]|nr:uroporphyrinogen-III synthase [Vulcanisaeta sp.]MCG2895097.1 uroporphyrinogen-III synthase [Vulcanisaeta sp.]